MIYSNSTNSFPTFDNINLKLFQSALVWRLYFIMKRLNNCDELLAHLFEAYDDAEYACGGHLMFQGDICEIGGAMPDRWCILIPSCKFPRTVFAIDNYDENGQFTLYIFKGSSFVLDETLAVKLPAYVREELIATLEGEW